ncbi:MAG: sulfatase-like hydrolase/transferase [Rhodocyclaceae bacterium]|nr:sulfatase-like hydrolase/transferase [Rhodocyclaceae bacterium]
MQEAKAVSLPNFWACGTSMAVSVPCMFSSNGMGRFSLNQAGSEENLLDVVQRAGVNVLWLDNNSDSKGVALRPLYRNYRSPEINTVCDSECRDEGMLVPLQDYIDSHPKGDILIVLHQMGNHGPAYYKRYPPAFEKYRPACQSKDLSRCSNEEIGNAYDNAILYTDHFLGKTIELLKRNDKHFETALFYLSDHGESLGEGGVYLHGLPRAIAPDSQLHVPAILWFGSGYDEVDLPSCYANAASDSAMTTSSTRSSACWKCGAPVTSPSWMFWTDAGSATGAARPDRSAGVGRRLPSLPLL